jgi:hypothetical protein
VKAVASTVDLHAIIKEKDLEIERLRKLILATPNVAFLDTKDEKGALDGKGMSIDVSDMNRKSSGLLEVLTPSTTPGAGKNPPPPNQFPVSENDVAVMSRPTPSSFSVGQMIKEDNPEEESGGFIPPPPPLIPVESQLSFKAPTFGEGGNGGDQKSPV